MNLRSDIHEALDVVAPPAPHLAHVVMDALEKGAPPRRPARLRMVAAVALGVLLLAGAVVTFAIVLPFAPGSPAAPEPALALSGNLAVTQWVSDPSVVNGPHPGYRPQLATFDSSMVTGARVIAAPHGRGTWAVSVTLNARGRQTVAELTTAAADACPAGDCPEGHLTLWAGLTQDDVDHWNERAAALSRPVAEGGKLLADPSVVSPITRGTFFIYGDFSRRHAEDVARWLNARG
jgi:hypothetical protein